MTIRPVFALLFVAVAPVAALAGAPPATGPASPEEAVYRAELQMLEILLDEPSHDEMLDIGRHFRRREEHARAAVYDLIALRGKPKDFLIEYELACNFALWGQKKLATKYLTLAADHGYWGYRVVVEDTDLESIKDTSEFAAATKKIKANFDVQAPKNPPGMTVVTPQGAPPPPNGWPVLIFLHGWASERTDFDDDAKFVTTLGYVGVTLDATEVMGPGAFPWDPKSVEPTHAQIQAALKNLTVKIDPKRVYLQGFSQGGMHAARLAADYPESYRGVICNSPGAEQLTPTALKDPKQTGPIILSFGERDFDFVGANVKKVEALWKSAGRPARVIIHPGGHSLPPKQEEMFRDATKQFNEGT
jgi:predicted esterase